MSKLSVHTQKLQDCINWLETFPENNRPKYIHAIDPEKWAVEECNRLNVNVIVRHYYPEFDFNANNVNALWASGASAYMQAYNFMQSCRSLEWYAGCWGIVTPPAMAMVDQQHLHWAKDFMRYCILMAKEDGKEYIVSNVPTGNNGFEVIGAKYYGCQEYGSPNILSQSPYHALRYRDWYPNISNAQGLFILEFGVTDAVEGGLDRGFRYLEQTPKQYWDNSILPYYQELLKDDYVQCAFLFQRSGFEDWSTFDIADTIIDNQLVNLYAEGEDKTMGYIERYSEMYNAWVAAGGIENNFKTFVIGQKAATGLEVTEEEIEAVVERAQSGIIELRLLSLRPKV